MSIANYPQKKAKRSQNNKIIVLLGQTATGKSDLAVRLAQKFNGEIISADSRQVYCGLNLGTGKITKKEMRGIPHHLLDVTSPSRRFTVAQYKKLAQEAIRKIQRKNKVPIICGGTGFYIQTLVDDLQIPEVKPNLKLRARLEKKSTPELFGALKKLDPRRAKNIDHHNRRRLIRALEIVMSTGRPVPSFAALPSTSSVIPGLTRNPDPGSRIKCGTTNALFLGIKKSQPELARRIKVRLQKRLKQGMLAEVKALRAQGLSWKRLDSFGLEYRWLAKFLQKKIEPRAQAKISSQDKTALSRLRVGRNPAPKANSRTSENQWPSGARGAYQEMTARLQKDIEHYAKRQMTWFKRDPRIHWIKDEYQAINITNNFLK